MKLGKMFDDRLQMMPLIGFFFLIRDVRTSNLGDGKRVRLKKDGRKTMIMIAVFCNWKIIIFNQF